ncbi:MAG: 2-succinyl-5-enolpyruvyl-6-hydroxy-3-cyclohexene-1-carboxylic-acid synthase [Bacteroidales bacterium]|jgi:2-succinyl-5-enolpyruvyl-6-hydroxy-3-cyclohexene-1-carboxylate synthase
MTTDKKPVALLADILIQKGLENLVHSPGSRNAPIIIAFSGYSQLKITTIFDERCAAFYALGMALASGKTVAIDCTSGTAPLNYAPAIAEAYYQHIPLLVLTADRSPQYIDIGDGQSIRQKGVFSNYIKQSYELPQSINSIEDFAQAEEMVNEAINQTMSENRGPVQLNIPLDEPLYETTETYISGTLINLTQKVFDANQDIPEIFKDQWKHSRKLLILAGQMNPDAELNEILINLTKKQQAVVLTETTSNQCHPDFIDGIDNAISAIQPEEIEDYQPDLLITIGGAVVSKMIKKFLREHPPKNHWHISASGEKMDTFFCLTGTIQSTPVDALKTLISQPRTSEIHFKKRWLDKKRTADTKREIFIENAPFSDLTVFNQIIKALPPLTRLHLGNSTPVRYSQLFGSQPGLSYFSNRGVSGIEGQISTAAGFATCSSKINVLITGDLGFLYDSNGLMLLTHCPNLKIVVINNQGGGIFRFIPGPDTVHNFEQYFEAHHNLRLELLTKAFSINYLYADSHQSVEEKVHDLFYGNHGAQVLEISTPAEINAEVLRNYFEGLRNR